jgi:hypothetical protein
MGLRCTAACILETHTPRRGDVDSEHGVKTLHGSQSFPCLLSSHTLLNKSIHSWYH